MAAVSTRLALLALPLASATTPTCTTHDWTTINITVFAGQFSYAPEFTSFANAPQQAIGLESNALNLIGNTHVRLVPMGQTCCTGAVAVSPEFGGVVQPIAGLASPFRDATLTGIVVQPTAGFYRVCVAVNNPAPFADTDCAPTLPTLLFILFLPSLSHSPCLRSRRCAAHHRSVDRPADGPDSTSLSRHPTATYTSATRAATITAK